MSPIVWEDVPEHLYPMKKKLGEVLESWRGTKYLPGQCCKGVGVDCVHFVSAVLSELTGARWVASERPPQDIGMHNRGAAMAALKSFLKSWPNHHDVLLRGRRAQPGDVLVLGSGSGGPGHAVIVGHEPNTTWQVLSASGVCKTGLTAHPAFPRLCRIYRGTDRRSW